MVTERAKKRVQQEYFDDDRDQMFSRAGLNVLAVILLVLAVALGLSLLAFPPTSGVFLGLAIAASVCLGCSAISKIWSYKIKQDMKKMSYQTQQYPAEGTSSDLTYDSSSSPRRSGSLRSRNSQSRSSSIGPESFHTAGSAESFETAEGPDDSTSFSDSGSNESLTRGST